MHVYVIRMNDQIDEKKEQKQKLTLGISKDVIEKAKATGINISSITEQVLKAITYDPKMNTEEDLSNAYQAFFDAITPSLKKYGATVQVGEMYEGDSGDDLWKFTIDLHHQGLSKNNSELEVYRTVKVNDVTSSLYKPTQILENLLRSLIEAAEHNKKKMQEFEIALRIVDALTEKPDTESKGNPPDMRRR